MRFNLGVQEVQVRVVANSTSVMFEGLTIMKIASKQLESTTVEVDY